MKRRKGASVSGQAIILELRGENLDHYVLTCWCVRTGIPFVTPDSYCPRRVDSMEQIYCPECERDHRLIRFWEAQALGLYEPRPGAEGLDSLLGPPRLTPQEEEQDPPLGPRAIA